MKNIGIINTLQHAWGLFRPKTGEPAAQIDNGGAGGYGPGYSVRPDRPRLISAIDRHIYNSILTRISLDVADVEYNHVRLDDNGRYIEEIDSGLNQCLNVEANIDQSARAFRQDIAMSLFDNGSVAIVPTETTLSPLETGGYDVKSMRVGEIVGWYPKHVRVRVYNEELGRRVELTVPKDIVAIVENPFYSVMNEPNSTLKRLIRKLSILDAIDEQLGSGRLDLIIQLPYTVKHETKRKQAEQRRSDIELQLTQSKHGIAYTDGTEKIVQLNRPVENKLLEEIEYLSKMLYTQLGLTEEIMNGTASEEVMLNYNNRTIKPIVKAVSEAMTRRFLSKTARTQKQAITFFRDPFQLVPLGDVAEIADVFSRNEILTPNELRSIIGMRPSNDARADELRNSNMPQLEPPPTNDELGEGQNES